MNNDDQIFPAFQQNNIPIVLSCNDLWVPCSGVLIKGIMDHASENNNYDFVIFNRDIPPDNKGR